ncbi:glycosyltransferase BC10-like [Diospyros lotus]|uniref:glycosyltransferase BC10-like n=1 Tax=Diospyros lotus TaxID=55363 RepID=UPI00225B42D6|nr:glycosyltransferase BC10-like [Diospyros lotus]
MLSPSPVSLLCALLLCVPLAVLFVAISPATTPTSAADGGDLVRTPVAISPNRSRPNPLTTFKHTTKNQQEMANNITTNQRAEDSSDESLFRRAARVNLMPSPPRKLAFMFLTTAPLPFAPLWELYFHQAPRNLYNIYIHADPRFRYHPPFSGVFEGRVIPSKPTSRHSPTLTSAARRLISHALLHDRSNSRFALLSPSCIPLHSFEFTYATLVGSGKSFIEILSNEVGAYERWAARGEDAMLPEVPFEDFRIGSQFFVVTRRHARMIVRDRRLWAKFMLPCLVNDACYPEEHYFATLLSMKDPRGCVPATLTHVDWAGRYDGHPRMYNASEVGPDLILVLRSHRPRYGDEEMNGNDSSVTERRDPFLFARKFSPGSVPRLLRMANDVIFRD